MGKLTCSVCEEEVAGAEFIASRRTLFACFELKLRQFLNRNGGLEEKHATSDVLTDIEGTCNGRINCNFLSTACGGGCEVGGEIIKQLAD